MIPVAKPILSGEELDEIKAVLESGILARGETVTRFEEKFAEYVDADSGIAVNNGTSGLHTALSVGEGDEVITTPFSFIATATSVLMPYCGGWGDGGGEFGQENDYKKMHWSSVKRRIAMWQRSW